jgi:hypothetical protein
MARKQKYSASIICSREKAVRIQDALSKAMNTMTIQPSTELKQFRKIEEDDKFYYFEEIYKGRTLLKCKFTNYWKSLIVSSDIFDVGRISFDNLLKLHG